MDTLAMRKAEIKRNGVWESIDFMDIKKDDVYRLFEADGVPVSSEGQTEFTAIEDAQMIDVDGREIGMVKNAGIKSLVPKN